MDFDRSVSKLKKEQEKRRAEAVRKAERERKAQEEAKKQHALIQHAVETRRRQQLEKEEHDRLAAEEERRITAGISYSEALLPFEVEGEGDKITLPPSALESLSKQDALAQGPMLFQLVLVPSSAATATAGAAGAGGPAAAGGGGGEGGLPPGARTTHAGVLEFSAEEGTVGLPLKVRKSLLGGIGAAGGAAAAAEGKEEGAGGGGSWAGAGCMVRVKYIRLEKGTYAKFQPRTGGLSQVPELKGMLEMNLLKHSTLTKGDLLQVWFRGKCFDLKVIELEPIETMGMQAVTVIDTDLTVDVDVPEEQEKEEQGREGGRTPRGGGGGQSLGGAGAGMGKRISPPRTLGGSSGTVGGGGGGGEGGKTLRSSGTGASSSSSTGPMRSATSAEVDVPEDTGREIMRYMKMNALGEEPAENEEGVINLMVRKPDGSMESRRFRKRQPFKDVFRFVDATSSVSDEGEEESYLLVTRFPRRVFSVAETAGQSVEEVLGAGTGKKEMLMYEAC